MYKIIGADGQEYGPVTAEQLREWIAQGRANARTRIQAEGAVEWRALAEFPEFAASLAALPSATAAVPPKTAVIEAEALGATIIAADYRVNIGDCIGRGWQLVKENFWLLVGVTFVAGVISAIPYLGILLAGPMTGGLFAFFLKRIRRQPAVFGDVFLGFSVALLPLLLGYVVSLALGGVGCLLCLAPGIYLLVAWVFALPLIIDKKLDFWPAMELSRKVVTHHWWAIFGLLLVAGLVAVGGVLLCCVGALVTMPIAYGAIMYAYEDIFGAPPAPPVGPANSVGVSA